jgi:hypothetical protein
MTTDFDILVFMASVVISRCHVARTAVVCDDEKEQVCLILVGPQPFERSAVE